MISDELHALVVDKERERGGNYNAGDISRDSYAVFGARSWANDVHKEAQRICSWLEQGNIEKAIEHTIDLAVYTEFLFQRLRKDAAAKLGLEVKA